MSFSRAVPPPLGLTSPLPIAIALACAGCSAQMLTTPVHPFEAEEPPAGALYFLPRSSVQIDFTVKITAKPKPNCGNPENDKNYSAPDQCSLVAAASAFTLSDAAITHLSRPDEQAAFLLSTPASFMMKTGFTASFSESGELTASSASFADQTAQFAALGLETLAKVAGRVAMAGPSPSITGREQARLRLAKVHKSIDALDDRLTVSVNDLKKDPPPRKPSEITEEVTKLLELRGKLVAFAAELEASTKLELQVPVRCVIEKPVEGTIDLNAACSAYQQVRIALTRAQISTPDGLPALALRLTQIAPSTGASSCTKVAADKEPASGFYYRIPAWATAELSSQFHSNVSATLPMPQWGCLALWSIDENDLRTGKEIAVELHPGLGSVKSVKLNGEPIATGELGKVVDAAQKLSTSLQDAKLEELKKEKARLDAEREALEAKKKLEEAKQ